jgi:hypothetical protein
MNRFCYALIGGYPIQEAASTKLKPLSDSETTKAASRKEPPFDLLRSPELIVYLSSLATRCQARRQHMEIICGDKWAPSLVQSILLHYGIPYFIHEEEEHIDGDPTAWILINRVIDPAIREEIARIPFVTFHDPALASDPETQQNAYSEAPSAIAGSSFASSSGQEGRLQTLLDLAEKKTQQAQGRRLTIIRYDDGWQASLADILTENVVIAYRPWKSHARLEDALEALILAS